MKSTAGVNEIIRVLGTIALILFILFLVMDSVYKGEKARQAIEESSILHVLRSSVNSLSTVESGYIERELTGTYDLVINCDGNVCRATITLLDVAGSEEGKSGEKQEKAKKGSTVLLYKKVKPADLRSIDNLCVMKGEEIEVKETCLS